MDFSENVYSVDIRKGTYEYIIGFDKGIAVSPSTSTLTDSSKYKQVCYSDNLDFFVGFQEQNFQAFNATDDSQFSDYQIDGGNKMKSCDFSPNGEYLLTGGESGDVFILNRSCNCVIGEYYSGSGTCISCDTYMSNCYKCIAATTYIM